MGSDGASERYYFHSLVLLEANVYFKKICF